MIVYLGKEIIMDQENTEINHRSQNLIKDLIITIADIETEDDVPPYPITHIYRFDLIGNIKNFIDYIEKYPDVIEGGQMRNM